MNEQALASINNALAEAVKNYRPFFREIEVYDTTKSTSQETNIQIANYVLNQLEQFLDPEILVLDRKLVESCIQEHSSSFSAESSQRLLSFIAKHAQFVKRSLAERTDDLVQVIACGLLIHAEKIFLFKREDKDPKAKLYGKSTIWQGGHISYADAPFEELIKNTLFAKLKERLFLNRTFNIELLGYAWDEANPESRRHLGLLYELEIDSEDVANDLQAKAFKSGRGYGLLGQFWTPNELSEKGSELQLESWSAKALEARIGGA